MRFQPNTVLAFAALVTTLCRTTCLAQSDQLDPSFSGNGTFTTTLPPGNASAQAILIDPNGKILVGGYAGSNNQLDFGLIRLNPDGTLDPTFSGDGRVRTGFYPGDERSIVASVLSTDSSGYLAIGTGEEYQQNGELAIARYDNTGALASWWGTGGKVTFGYVGDTSIWMEGNAVMQPDGKILMNARMDKWTGNRTILIRMNDDGSLDTTFGVGGIAISTKGIRSYAGSVALQPDGRIVVASSVLHAVDTITLDMLVERYLEDGTLDTTFADSGSFKMQFSPGGDDPRCVRVLSDGRIVVAGLSRFWSYDSQLVIFRLTSDGTLDSTFATDGSYLLDLGLNLDALTDLVVDDLGRLVASGTNEMVGYNNATLLLRLDPDGHPDPTFGTNGLLVHDHGATDDSFKCLALQPDGKIVAAGYSDSNLLVDRFLPNSTVGVAELHPRADALLVYPDPATDHVMVANAGAVGALQRVLLMDTHGIVVQQFAPSDLHFVANGFVLDLPRSLAAGPYIVAVRSTRGVQHATLIKLAD